MVLVLFQTNEKPVPQITNPFKRYICIKTQIDRSQVDFSDVNNKQYISNVRIERDVVINESSFDDKRIGNQVLENEGNLIAKTANNGPIHGFDFNRKNEIEQVNFNSNDFDTSYMSKVLNEVFKNRNNINGRDYNNANGVNTTTEEQRRILYEEPLNTSNAMKAVMGYEPKDDRRICRFTNPGTNSCFKGAKCKLEHVEKMRGEMGSEG